jgi:hypothetical protein
VIFQFNQDVKVPIKNFKNKPSVVVLLPITRTSSKARRNWAKILEILKYSEVSSLIILDKTINEEGTSYFSEHFKFEHINLYIVRRPPYEPIYDSQGYISLDNGLWILQLHDDDEWDGALKVPNDAQELELFSTNFYFLGGSEGKNVEWENSPPARINFTLIPSIVWNKFVEFIDCQGGHVAGSVDSTLNLVSRLICKHHHLSTFHYKYDNRHWQNRQKASKNLSKLAKQDGWLRLASVEIQLLNRNIDNLVALRFFENLIPKNKIEKATLNSLKNFQPTLKRRLLTPIRYQIFCTLVILVDLICSTKKISCCERFQSLIKARIALDLLILKSWKIKNKIELLELIGEIKKSQDFPLLTTRFSFWEASLKL